ncbi:hypothetical protein P689_119192 [Candidatus Riesia pediculischaeffi PTSU]|uniref:Uncharacterized protein n=1 Tax=Candidatus Riesia pediculischaeffi PTSU TaxID=1401651 RepID=A0A0C1SAC7_9ENTR|nr:hypothetical protein P689_119192 [Candidatus Riesia pediculischaeffi PTSU]
MDVFLYIKKFTIFRYKFLKYGNGSCYFLGFSYTDRYVI